MIGTSHPSGVAEVAPNRVTVVHRFALLSGIGWVLDFSVFNVLAWWGVALFTANLVGATVGVTWVFLTARATIFRSRRTSLPAAIAAYALWNLLGILVASVIIAVLAQLALGSALPARLWSALPVIGRMPFARVVPPLSKIAVTPFTMYANFVMMGLITERRLRLR